MDEVREEAMGVRTGSGLWEALNLDKEDRRGRGR